MQRVGDPVPQRSSPCPNSEKILAMMQDENVPSTGGGKFPVQNDADVEFPEKILTTEDYEELVLFPSCKRKGICDRCGRCEH
jgi:hypothetical protein